MLTDIEQDIKDVWVAHVSNEGWREVLGPHPNSILGQQNYDTAYKETDFMIVNDFHAYCKACEIHIYSRSDPGDELSFFISHMQGNEHRVKIRGFSKDKMIFTPLANQPKTGPAVFECNACEKKLEVCPKFEKQSLEMEIGDHITHEHTGKTHDINVQVISDRANRLLISIGTLPVFTQLLSENLCQICGETIDEKYGHFGHIKNLRHMRALGKMLTDMFQFHLKELRKAPTQEELITRLIIRYFRPQITDQEVAFELYNQYMDPVGTLLAKDRDMDLIPVNKHKYRPNGSYRGRGRGFAHYTQKRPTNYDRGGPSGSQNNFGEKKESDVPKGPRIRAKNERENTEGFVTRADLQRVFEEMFENKTENTVKKRMDELETKNSSRDESSKKVDVQDKLRTMFDGFKRGNLSKAEVRKNAEPPKKTETYDRLKAMCEGLNKAKESQPERGYGTIPGKANAAYISKKAEFDAGKKNEKKNFNPSYAENSASGSSQKMTLDDAHNAIRTKSGTNPRRFKPEEERDLIGKAYFAKAFVGSSQKGKMTPDDEPELGYALKPGKSNAAYLKAKAEFDASKKNGKKDFNPSSAENSASGNSKNEKMTLEDAHNAIRAKSGTQRFKTEEEQRDLMRKSNYLKGLKLEKMPMNDAVYALRLAMEMDDDYETLQSMAARKPSRSGEDTDEEDMDDSKSVDAESDNDFGNNGIQYDDWRPAFSRDLKERRERFQETLRPDSVWNSNPAELIPIQHDNGRQKGFDKAPGSKPLQNYEKHDYFGKELAERGPQFVYDGPEMCRTYFEPGEHAVMSEDLLRPEILKHLPIKITGDSYFVCVACMATFFVTIDAFRAVRSNIAFLKGKWENLKDLNNWHTSYCKPQKGPLMLSIVQECETQSLEELIAIHKASEAHATNVEEFTSTQEFFKRRGAAADKFCTLCWHAGDEFLDYGEKHVHSIEHKFRALEYIIQKAGEVGIHFDESQTEKIGQMVVDN